MKKSNYILVVSFALFVLSGCAQEAAETPAQPPLQSPVSLQTQIEDALGASAQAPAKLKIVGKIIQRMDAGRYTYLELESGSASIWAAVPASEAKVGDVVEVRSPSPMDDFRSPTLNRTFKLIYFGSGLVGDKAPVQAAAQPSNPAVQVKVPEGGITVEAVHARVAELAGQVVKVGGKVVKFNAAILGVNWIHIQDGSGNASAGTHDLTLTTDATVGVGDNIVVEGLVVQDKDFGAGYRYSVILEKSKLVQ